MKLYFKDIHLGDISNVNGDGFGCMEILISLITFLISKSFLTKW